jgi:hypothetical protein
MTITLFQDYAADIRPALNAAIRSQLKGLLAGSEPTRAMQAGDCFVGGKQLRGVLLCLIAEAHGGSRQAALQRAVAIELIQAATLVHDDFVDQHRSRRRRPALWTLDGARRAVLLGDMVFSSAIHLMSELGREDGGIVAKAIADLSRGAWQEPLDTATLLEGGPVDYERIIALKTGILFAAACELGAVAAGIAKPLQQRWRCYGQQIGEAYQLTDDLQELQQVLDHRPQNSERLAELAPALLFYVPASHAAVCQALRRKALNPDGELWPRLHGLAKIMKEERERRLQGALAGLAGAIPEGPLGRLLRRAPWDLLGMFDAEGQQTAGTGTGDRVPGN